MVLATKSHLKRDDGGKLGSKKYTRNDAKFFHFYAFSIKKLIKSVIDHIFGCIRYDFSVTDFFNSNFRQKYVIL